MQKNKIRIATALILLLVCFTDSGFAQGTAGKNVSQFLVDSKQLGKRNIWVWVPQDYADSRKKLPVIYMHDAQNLFDKNTSFVGEWRVDETLDSLRAQVIVVGIEHGNDKRLEELTPYPNTKHGGGKADNYLDFLINVLKPYIDKTYRTKTDAKNTAIIGSSLGGLTSFYAALKHPEIFGKAGVFSPSFWYSDDIYKFAESRKKIRSKMYLLAGDSESDDMVPDLNKMFDIAKQRSKQRTIKKVIVKGGKHNEKLWRESFAKAYLWLFG